VIRQPGYLGLLVNSLGWALGFRSGVGGARVADHSPLLARIRAEETPPQFDGEYDICCARTSRPILRNYEDQPRLASTFELFDSLPR
jgi:hypothetical protein